MNELTNERKEELRNLVYTFFADECDVDVSKLTESTDILTELEGDSLMFIEFLESMKKKYKLNIELQSVGKYLLKHPAETIGKAVDLCCLLYQHENNIVNLI